MSGAIREVKLYALPSYGQADCAGVRTSFPPRVMLFHTTVCGDLFKFITAVP